MLASSKETPCLRRFCVAFSESHSNVSFTASLYPSEMTQRLTAEVQRSARPYHQTNSARSARADPLQRRVSPLNDPSGRISDVRNLRPEERLVQVLGRPRAGS